MKLKNYLLEEKLLIYSLFAFILVSILSIISNILIGFAFSINYKWFGSIIFSAIALKLALNKTYLTPIKYIMSSFILFVFLPIGYITSGGSILVVGYLLIVANMINYLFSGKSRVFFNASIVIVFFAMIFLKESYPSIFPVFTERQHFFDALFQVPIILFLSFLMLSVFSNAYRNERIKLEEYGKLLNEKNKELEKLSVTDHLTGLYNRRYIFSLLDEISKDKTNSVIILVDLDNFKQVNDRFGHDAGDKVILDFSDKISAVIGDKGIVGRYGGDEFLIILQDVNLVEGEKIANHILEEISKLTFELDFNISVSGGVTLYDGKKNIKEVISSADQLLYKVKSSGKNDIMIES
ncbi:hypothetical protein CIB95_09300 [Lottiidibacillus patelloidae]|uniref:GGDEF domain-containing protein n=1 Tax=Lottiidibacillus patelloidae TaxID=2670334 RepID=A0A263BUV5_9BACI|nr:GGDEF domain-containing protein [Lottiidibacillus patelloidae]OZM56956.1 hypothetical protein CIB95_09300 [Lottiidibacillus patelloidae]